MDQRLLKWFARLVVVCTTLPFHEFAHGWMAHKLGDDTAQNQGRLTLNPIVHIDLLGGLLILFTGFGWAKPVPVNPSKFNSRHSRRGGMALTAAAGPAANILLALILMFLLKLLYIGGTMAEIVHHSGFVVLWNILYMMVSINISLAVFNLLPVPPLDGYSVFSYFLPAKLAYQISRNSQIIFIVLMVFCFSGVFSMPIGYVSTWIFRLLDGLTFFMGRLYG